MPLRKSPTHFLPLSELPSPDFGIILDSCGTDFGFPLDSSWNHFGIILDHVWIVLGSLLESFGDNVWIMLGPFWIVLGSFLNHFGIVLGQLPMAAPVCPSTLFTYSALVASAFGS